MAAVAEMGEVDEMISKEEGGIITNGDLSNDIDMENDSQDSLKKASLPESMEVDELEEENGKADKLENTSLTEDSNDCNEDNDDNTAGEDEASSVASENPSDSHSAANEDESSQDTKMSEDQTEEQNELSEEQEDTKEIDIVKEELVKNEEEDREEKEKVVKEEDEVKDDEDDEDKSKGAEKDSRHSTETSLKQEENSEKTESQEDVVHEIHSDDEEEKKIPEEPIELNDSGGEGDGDVMIVDEPKQNGTAEIINLDNSPKKNQSIKSEDPDIAPRRSSRNLNKSKSYVESDKESEKEESPHLSEESDVEEVLPQDPLACSDAVTVERIPAGPKPLGKPPAIVVKNTKRLVEIASKSNSPSQGKKEPTLVIIDTNSILSGRGPVPVNNKPGSIPLSSPSFPAVLPMALPAQGMYPPNMRATITPIPMNATISNTPPAKITPATISPAVTTPLLPTLTDDMFVVEAPSFIVPYVYEKPPVKDFKNFIEDIQKEDNKEKKEDEEEPKREPEDPKKPYSYFDSPLGKFFINIGFGLVQEFVQSDLLRQQKRKHGREGGSNPETEKTIRSLAKNLEQCRPANEPFKLELRKCEFCNFKTESALAMSYHLETPHMKNFVYKCNFCAYEVRSPHDILFHMEAEHAVRGHLERAPAFHQCPNCPFEDNGKGKLSRHLVTCMKKFKPERNLEPPIDWEPPAKIPRVPKIRQQGLNATAAAYQAMSKSSQYQFLSKMQLQGATAAGGGAVSRGRGRPSLGGGVGGYKAQAAIRPQAALLKQQQAMGGSGGSVLVPTSYQLNQVFQVVGGQELSRRLGHPGHVFLPNMSSASSTMAIQNQAKKAGQQQHQQQPSISITPLPRSASASASATATPAKPGDTTSKNAFVICEICDGYIKDLEQLRNHMQWIHKIKIHPKMIYNRPPLNCQKCQYRFFTDQGLERHLLGTHGLVTSSMQDAANKSKDSGRCPVCGRVYQWKLLNHVARDHNMTLKPAHLSYKCTVCTATFGMYKQFENHVYSAHSVVAKRVMDKKAAPATSAAGGSTPAKADQLKPLKINDEITIIPQPAKPTNGAGKEAAVAPAKGGGAAGSSKSADASSAGASRAEKAAPKNVDVKE